MDFSYNLFILKGSQNHHVLHNGFVFDLFKSIYIDDILIYSHCKNFLSYKIYSSCKSGNQSILGIFLSHDLF